MILIEGRVSKVEADTTGWGETLRVVGVAVTVKFKVTDQLGDYEKETVLHLPSYVRQPMVGDLLMVEAHHVQEGEIPHPDEAPPEWPLEDSHVDTEFEERTEV